MDIEINESEFFSYFFGVNDRVLKELKEKFNIVVIIANNKIIINGDYEVRISKYIKSLYKLFENKLFLKEEDIINGIDKLLTEDYSYDYLLNKKVKLVFQGIELKPKNRNQKEYLEAIDKNDICFGVGPAGTGKTYLAVAMAVNYLLEKKVERILLTRPAVEAGESLGYLPGDLKEKIDPYLRPLYDALFEMLGHERAQKYIERNIIEVAPLAYMRGRTLNNSFIILDEAQNTTITQMKMFLTRFGFNSKAVVTGDITQIDLKRGEQSGLIHAVKILRDINGLYIMEFHKEDVVRHKIVKEILNAYESIGETV